MRTAQVELVKLVAHNLRAPLRSLVAGELLIEKLNPAAVDLFGLGRGMRGVAVVYSIRIGRYTMGPGCGEWGCGFLDYWGERFPVIQDRDSRMAWKVFSSPGVAGLESFDMDIEKLALTSGPGST